MDPRFEFYEIVRVISDASYSRRLAGMEGAILGKAQDDQGRWVYGVHLYDFGECWSIYEDDLEPTGRMDCRESFYDGTSVRVVVDPATGEGSLGE